MTSVCAQTYGYCERHGNSYAGAPCAECVAEIPAPLHLARLIHELRTAQGTLEARIADQDGEIAALRRRVSELEQGNADRQRAHNTLAKAVEQLEPRL
jgi:L-lactate utilization protein LutB